MGKAVARNRKTKAETLAEAQRALEMRLSGVRDYYICEELGISLATLRRRIDLALAHTLTPVVDRYRTEQRERLSEYRRRLLAEVNAPMRELIDPATGEPVVISAAGPAEVAALIGKLIALEERLAKLDGLDAPTRISVETQVDAELAALADQLGANDRERQDA